MEKSNPKVYLSCPFQDEMRAFLGETAEVSLWPEWTPVPQDALAKECADATGLMSQVFDPVGVDLFETSPDLKVVSIVGSGIESVDVAAATSRGIPVGNMPGAAIKGTADMAMALLLAAARRIAPGRQLGARSVYDGSGGLGSAREHPGNRRLGTDWDRSGETS